MSTATQTESGRRGRRFLINVLWTWAGVAVNVVVAALLSPYIIRKLGEAKFSVWTLSLSFIEYFWLIDIGLRQATVKFAAEYRAAGKVDELRRIFNTGFLYSTVAGVMMAAVAIAASGELAALLRISDTAFPFLLSIVGASWAFGMSMNIMTAALEGHQRFDVITRIWVTGLLVRSIGTALLVWKGFGLRPIGIMMLVAQILMTALTWLALRSLISDVPIRPQLASWPVLKRMVSYGKHSMKVLVSNRLLNQSAPFLIAYFLPIAYVAYYTVPLRILEYVFDAIGRVGMVTMPNTAELWAQKKTGAIAQLAILANRYSLTLYLPLTVFLTLYSFELYALWIRPEFALNSAHLVPIMALAYSIAAGQHNSVSVLFGMARHQLYSTMLLIEALVVIGGLIVVLPRFGLIGAVCLLGTTMVINRSGLVCWLVSRELGISPLRYAAKIYPGPLAAAALTLLAGHLLKPYIPGNTWFSLILAGSVQMFIYLPLAFVLALTPEHRQVVMNQVSLRLGSLSGRPA